MKSPKFNHLKSMFYFSNILFLNNNSLWPSMCRANFHVLFIFRKALNEEKISMSMKLIIINCLYCTF